MHFPPGAAQVKSARTGSEINEIEVVHSATTDGRSGLWYQSKFGHRPAFVMQLWSIRRRIRRWMHQPASDLQSEKRRSDQIAIALKKLIEGNSGMSPMSVANIASHWNILGFPGRSAAKMLGIMLRTSQNYASGSTTIPGPVEKLLRSMFRQQIDSTNSD
jgi:hypothetical protein